MAAKKTEKKQNIKTETVPVKILGREVVHSDDEWFNNWPNSENPDYELEKVDKDYIEAYAAYVKAKRILSKYKNALKEEYVKRGIMEFPWEIGVDQY